MRAAIQAAALVPHSHARRFNVQRFLVCYPFRDERIRLVEGFAAYDGVLGDLRGDPHKGIDYVLPHGGRFRSFDVCSMHRGAAVQGRSRTWGRYVLVYAKVGGAYVRTVSAHLRTVAAAIPLTPKNPPAGWIEEHACLIPAGYPLGRAGATGKTHRIIQLHLELHRREEDGAWEKLDPYGLNDRASSGRYPQPGEPLTRLPHLWQSDSPPFAPP
ncbi:MAG: hypothetical protein HYZ09_00155 [Candidatus Kerfeldbacteria bacterium]|nr:hypothetical protein [Candidatus Kerfeldbacteria bacterium]